MVTGTTFDAEEIARFDQKRKRMSENLRRWIYDRALARGDKWAKTGDHFARPYGDGSSSSAAVIPKAEPLGLYYKLMSEDKVRGTRNLSADLKIWLHQYAREEMVERQEKIAALVNQASLPSHVRQKDIKFPLTLANKALSSKVTLPEVSTTSVRMMETCPICLEDKKVGKMFTISGCLHHYCFSCTKKHVEVKLLQGMLPKCPHNGCKTDLTIEICKPLLASEFYEIMSQRVKESSIAAKDKIYCPYPRCSTLMSRTEKVFINTLVGRPSKCTRCRGMFCMSCKVPWHNNMSCATYVKSNPYPCAEDAKLKSLARKNQWRQCVKCSHMVELAEGCNHVRCRCGYEFCYICGAEWRNKKATCFCPLWDEHSIIYDVNDRRQRRRIN